jgi:hypothetical protein
VTLVVIDTGMTLELYIFPLFAGSSQKNRCCKRNVHSVVPAALIGVISPTEYMRFKGPFKDQHGFSFRGTDGAGFSVLKSDGQAYRCITGGHC